MTAPKPSAETTKMTAIAEAVMTKRAAATAHLKAMPRERFWSKVWKTVVGGLVALFGIRLVWAGVHHSPDPVMWLVMVGLAVVIGGAHVASQDLTKAALAFVLGAVRDLAGTFLSKKNSTPP
jgi:hypothetical protein